MTWVRENPDGTIDRLYARTVIESLDGARKAPLAVITHESWTDEERAEYGVFKAKRPSMPKGKIPSGNPKYERSGNDIVELVDFIDEPTIPVRTHD